MTPDAFMKLRESFTARFGGPPSFIARSPGRVNLIGEHTDYNEGFVLPMAIDRSIRIACRPRSDDRVLVHSLDYEESAEFRLDPISKGGPAWTQYIKGVAWALNLEGVVLRGWEGVMEGDVPKGAGLSSSAAFELAVARVFSGIAGHPWDPVKAALLCQKAENKWVGVNCGIMDQLISAAATAGHALLIDCRTLTFQPVPLPPGTVVVIMDTKTRRGLVDSAYNERRSQCEAASRALDVRFLRDTDLSQLATTREHLDHASFRRARHVISENARTVEAAEAMRSGDAARMGRLMMASHESLRDDFEVSTRELNTIVDAALAAPSCHGARMTGAGFGGCAVALVQASNANLFCEKVREGYLASTGIAPELYACHPSAGTELIPVTTE